MFEHLKASLIDDFLGGRIDIVFPEIVASMKNTLRRVLSQKIIDTKTFKTIRTFELNSRQTIMILSGLLRFEVLKLMLMKRWRVNYGPVQSCNWAPIIQSRFGHRTKQIRPKRRICGSYHSKIRNSSCDYILFNENSIRRNNSIIQLLLIIQVING